MIFSVSAELGAISGRNINHSSTFLINNHQPGWSTVDSPSLNAVKFALNESFSRVHGFSESESLSCAVIETCQPLSFITPQSLVFRTAAHPFSTETLQFKMLKVSKSTFMCQHSL